MKYLFHLFTIFSLILLSTGCSDPNPEPPTIKQKPSPSISTINTNTGNYKTIVYDVKELERSLSDKFGSYHSNARISGFYFTPVPHPNLRGRLVFKVEAVLPTGRVLGDTNNSILLKRTAVIVSEVRSVQLIGSNPLYVYQSLGERGFSRKDLQYYQINGTFEKAFLSKADLKFIFDTGPFIGISGSYANSGNIQVINIPDANSQGTLVDVPSVNYFNLKFASFERAKLKDLTLTVLDKNINNLIADIGLDSSLEFGYLDASIPQGTSIPATTFSAPCPPRWVPR